MPVHVPHLSRRARRRASTLLTIAATLAIAVPMSVLASHQFADVPDGGFHNDISKIADAGITSGCGGGNYCPSTNVTRDQMAAFMSRGFGVAGGNRTETFIPVPSDASTPTVLAEVTMRTPGTTGGTGYIHVTASATWLAAYDAVTPNCPCLFGVALKVDGTLIPSATGLTGAGTEPVPFIFGTAHVVNTSFSWTIEVPTNTDITLSAVGYAVTDSGEDASALGTIDAVYAPFMSGGTGVTPVGGAGSAGAFGLPAGLLDD